MKWQKKGVIFSIETHNLNLPWSITHTQIPTVGLLTGTSLRVYYGTRDVSNRTYTSFIDIDYNNPSNILYVHRAPILELGSLGCFDDSGIMPSCVVQHQDGTILLYYIGWNKGGSTKYRTAIGLAVSKDGISFKKSYEGPIIDRSTIDPIFVTTPFVVIEKGVYRMWYCSCDKWITINNISEPHYQIKYLESKDGAIWQSNNKLCFSNINEEEVNTRPVIVKYNNKYIMWYCYRKAFGYKTDKNSSYKIGYAESTDGISWKRLNKEGMLDLSHQGWDSEMVAYPAIYQNGKLWYLLYNGNGFGRSGIGYAVAEEN